MIRLSGTVFSQTLQKGNLVGVHVYNINLKPDVTPNQMKDLIINKLIPVYESNPGANMYLTKCIRGENKYSYGLIVIFKSESERNKFYNEEGELIELGIALPSPPSPVKYGLVLFNHRPVFKRSLESGIPQRVAALPACVLFKALPCLDLWLCLPCADGRWNLMMCTLRAPRSTSNKSSLFMLLVLTMLFI